MFDSIKGFFDSGDKRSAEVRKLESEADQFKLPSETLPQILKYVFFAGLAALNYRLFAEAVPGNWGIATGILAMMAEAIALYSSHYFSRSSGAFRITLAMSGVVLMAFSLIHGTFSILDLIGIADISDTVQWYSRVVAFPLLAALLGLSVVAMTMTHPNNLVRLREALAHTRIAANRAEAASDARLMRTRFAIEDARLEHRLEQTRRESEYLEALKAYIGIEEEKRRLIHAIPDLQLRESLAREMGIENPPQDAPKSKPGFTNQVSPSGGVLD